jgi:hypothetical protein
MFLHAKHVESRPWCCFRCRIIAFALAVSVLGAASLPCHAEVYKCIGANGRMVIGDQPCTVKDTVVAGAKERFKEPLPRATVNRVLGQSERDSAAFSQDYLEQKIQLKHDPECRGIRIQLKKNGHFASKPLLVEATLSDADKLIWEHYRISCLSQAKDVVVLDEAQKDGASLERVRKAACDIKTRDYEKRRQTVNASSSDLEANALAVLQAEVLRGCR